MTPPDASEPAFHIEAMQPSDITAVMRIDEACFPTPWTAEAYQEELARPQAHIDVVRRRVDGAVVAYCDSWVVADEVQIVNIATDPVHRRQGHARTLLAHLVARARTRVTTRVTLEVRRSNEAAIALYHKLGFRSVGVRPGYYQRDNEDALLMNLEID